MQHQCSRGESEEGKGTAVRDVAAGGAAGLFYATTRLRNGCQGGSHRSWEGTYVSMGQGCPLASKPSDAPGDPLIRRD